MSRTSPKGRRLVQHFWHDYWRHRTTITGAYAWRALAVAGTLLTPWPLKLIVDHVTTGSPETLGVFSGREWSAWLVPCLAAGSFALAVGAAIANAAEKNLSAKTRERLTSEIRERTLAHMLTLSPMRRARQRSGEMVLRVVDDTDLFVRVLTKTLPQVFQHAVTLIATLATMAWVEPRVTAIACAWLPFVVLVLRRDARQLWTASREKRAREGEVCSLAQEIVRGIPQIQASGAEQRTRELFSEVNRRRMRAGREESAVAVSLERTLQILQGLALATTTGVGGWLVLHQRLTAGDLTLLMFYVSQLFKPIERLNDLAETAGRGWAGGERLARTLERRPAVTDGPGAIPITRALGIVEFDNVWFTYADRLRPVLRGATLRACPGELLVLVGESGAGKSTVVSLLVRLWDPARGEIRLDGRPIRAITLQSLRAQFAVLSQDIHIFAGSIRQALTPPGAAVTEPGLWQALQLVALDDFVRQLPQQLDTRVGEDGASLSGGQRRRLSLARAFLGDRPVLLLDEPLANIDAASAAVILDALDALRRERTCIAVTHDAALVERADRVCRLQDGRLVASARASQARALAGSR